MSHFTTIQTVIKDIDALRAACGELKLAVLEKAEARGYGNNRYPGDYVIQLSGPFDIAVVRQTDSSFALVTDWWQGHVEQEVGKNYGRLHQLYAVHKATHEARRKGLTVRRSAIANGSIKLTLTSL